MAEKITAVKGNRLPLVTACYPNIGEICMNWPLILVVISSFVTYPEYTVGMVSLCYLIKVSV